MLRICSSSIFVNENSFNVRLLSSGIILLNFRERTLLHKQTVLKWLYNQNIVFFFKLGWLISRFKLKIRRASEMSHKMKHRFKFSEATSSINFIIKLSLTSSIMTNFVSNVCTKDIFVWKVEIYFDNIRIQNYNIQWVWKTRSDTI